MKRFIIASICVLLSLFFTFADSYAKTSTATIYRDDYGAPHIFSQDSEGLFFGFGYAAGQDRLFQMDILRRTYWGRVSEVHGAKFLEFDKAMRRDNLTRAQVRDQIGSLDKEYQIILRSYADGINASIRDSMTDPSERLPAEFQKFDIAPEKWEAEDVAAVFISVMGVFMDSTREMENRGLLDFLIKKHGEKKGQAIFKDLVWGNDPHAFATIAAGAKVNTTSQKKAQRTEQSSLAAGLKQQVEMLRDAYGELAMLPARELPAASYAFVVAPKRSATGNALLMGGPQFGSHLPSDLYEAGLHGAGIDAVGSTLVGYPFLMFGHNGKSAFSSTAGVDNITDIFEEKLNSKNPHQYWFMGKWRSLDVRKEIFKVKNEAPKEVIFYYTVHGPVIKMDEAKGLAYAKQISCKEDYLAGFVSFHELMKAQTPEAFKKAASLSPLSVNVYYADTAGNIGYYHQGKYPKRSAKVSPLFPTPGTGEFEWEGFIPVERNPQAMNPESGVFANWNNKPAREWSNGDLGGIFGGVGGWGVDQRVTVLMDSVKGKDKISIADLQKMIQDINFSHLGAQRFKTFLLEAGKKNKSPDPKIEKALGLLAAWDDRWTDQNNDGFYDHPGLTIFNAWWDLALKNTFEDELGDHWASLENFYGGPYNWEKRKRYQGNPLFLRAILGKKASKPTAVDYFNGKRDEILVKSLGEAIERVEKKFGTADMNAWKTPVTPMAFVPTTIHGVTSTAEKVKATFFMERGTENHIVELKKEGAEGVMVVPPGSSGFVKQDGTKSPYYEDQFEMFNKFEYKPLLMKQDTIRDNAKSVQELTYTYE